MLHRMFCVSCSFLITGTDGRFWRCQTRSPVPRQLNLNGFRHAKKKRHIKLKSIEKGRNATICENIIHESRWMLISISRISVLWYTKALYSNIIKTSPADFLVFWTGISNINQSFLRMHAILTLTEILIHKKGFQIFNLNRWKNASVSKRKINLRASKNSSASLG